MLQWSGFFFNRYSQAKLMSSDLDDGFFWVRDHGPTGDPWPVHHSTVKDTPPGCLDSELGFCLFDKSSAANRYALCPATFPLKMAIAKSFLDPLLVLLLKCSSVCKATEPL